MPRSTNVLDLARLVSVSDAVAIRTAEMSAFAHASPKPAVWNWGMKLARDGSAPDLLTIFSIRPLLW